MYGELHVSSARATSIPPAHATSVANTIRMMRRPVMSGPSLSTRFYLAPLTKGAGATTHRVMSFLDSRTRVHREGFGQPLPRKEDGRLVTGRGRFSDDVSLPGQAYAAMVRSPHAHARLRAIDVGAAQKAPDVVAVLTGWDVLADGLRPIPHRPVPTNPHEVPLRSPDGSAFYIAPHPLLPVDRARFVGEAVAMVIAESAAAARDAAEQVTVDWEPLPAVTSTLEAAEAG